MGILLLVVILGITTLLIVSSFQLPRVSKNAFSWALVAFANLVF